MDFIDENELSIEQHSNFQSNSIEEEDVNSFNLPIYEEVEEDE
jgi:hypothetical protein